MNQPHTPPTDSGVLNESLGDIEANRRRSREVGSTKTKTAPRSPSLRIKLPPINLRLAPEDRADEVMRLAQEAFSQTGSWVLFYREIMGVDGIVRKLFPTPELLRDFERSAQCEQLLEMTAAMRSDDTGKGDELEPQKMITVRLPRSLHEAMKKEADEHETSINKLCISKLLSPISPLFVPTETGGVRGRKPGPQDANNRLITSDDEMA